jgi:hypothetical protein
MDALAAESFLNAAHKVCGLNMRPLSVGHAFTLEALESPFYHGQLGTEADLRISAWICSRPPLALPETDSLAFRIWSGADIDFAQEVERWKAYVADYCAPPQFWTRTPKAGEAPNEPSKIPPALHTVVRLMRLGFAEKEAWATPAGAAAWYEAAAFEQESGSHLDIVTDGERAAIARSKQREEAPNG